MLRKNNVTVTYCLNIKFVCDAKYSMTLLWQKWQAWQQMKALQKQFGSLSDDLISQVRFNVVSMLRAVCQSAQFVKRAAQFRNRACAVCKFLT